MLHRWLLVLLGLLALASVSVASGGSVPASELGASVYPEWAHHHWVWLSNEVANQSKELAFVKGFLDRNVPVGAVDIDSEWSTGINNFVWDTEKYPDAKGMIDEFHSLGVRVICWCTSMIDTNSPSYQEGFDKGYYLNWGHTIKWWHGWGSFLDYTNPEAVAWWNAQLDNVLNMGLDGFKNDGTDPYVLEFEPDIHSSKGPITYREYADSYYGSFWNYSRSKNPEALIMSRPVDSRSLLYWSFSPRYVVFSGWVGDQDPTFDGLQDALRNMFHSAWRGYVGFGSDIGGYRHGPPPLGRTKQLFLRWAQVGAFCSLMENGGNGEHAPWMFDSTNQTLDIYRTYVDTHMSLVPYLLSAGNTAWTTGVSIMSPIANETVFTPYSWDYMLWHDVFVCPIVEDEYTRHINFPPGSNWVYWWDNKQVYQGGISTTIPAPLGEMPAFHRQGSMLPLNITKDMQDGHGNADSLGALTVFVPYPHPSIPSHQLPVYQWNGDAQELVYKWSSADSIDIIATAHERPLLFHFLGVSEPKYLQDNLNDSDVTYVDTNDKMDIKSLRASEGLSWMWTSEDNALWISVPSAPKGLSLSVHGILSRIPEFTQCNEKTPTPQN